MRYNLFWRADWCFFRIPATGRLYGSRFRDTGMKLYLDNLFPLYFRYGLKIGIACVLSYAMSYLVGAPYPIWAVVSAIVAMQLNVAESLNAGLLRIMGTVAGAGLGVLLLLTIPKTPLFLMLALFIIAALCGYIARYTNVASAIAIAAVVVFFTGAQQLNSGNTDAITFGLMRVVEIAVGVGSAFFVSLILWPVRLVDTLRADLGLQFLESTRLLDSLLNAFISGETLPYTHLVGLESKIWDNHERLSKARKHESLLFHYEHSVMKVQVTTLDRTTESLRSMLECLNDYDEENLDPLIGAELRILGDAVMATLRHLGGDSPTAAAPDLVRGLTSGVGIVEQKLAKVRQDGSTQQFNLHKMLQVFSFYQAMRLLAESLLLALDKMEEKAASRGMIQQKNAETGK